MHQDVCSNHSIDLMADSLFSLFSTMIFYIRHTQYIGSILGSSTGSIYQDANSTRKTIMSCQWSSLPSSVSQTVISSTAGRAMETAALLFPGSQIQLVDSILETDGGPLSLVPEFYVCNLFGIENTPLRQYPGAESNIAMSNSIKLSFQTSFLFLPRFTHFRGLS